MRTGALSRMLSPFSAHLTRQRAGRALLHSLRSTRPSATPPLLLARALSSSSASSSRPAIFELERSDVIPFGSPSLYSAHPVPTFSKLSLAIHDDGSCWAVLATAATAHNTHDLLLTLQSQARFVPAESARWPFLSTVPPRTDPRDGSARPAEVEDVFQLVSFKTRLGRSGEFQDYSARYGAIRDEDKLTVRQHLTDQRPADDASAEEVRHDVEATARALEMEGFLDLPLVTLSNGQTRRARIVAALLRKPELLILEEPFTGLDVASRGVLASHLEKLHKARNPRVLLILRPQDPLPQFVSHLILPSSEPGQLLIGPKAEILATSEAQSMLEEGERLRALTARRLAERKAANAARASEANSRPPVVELRKVNIRYGDKKERPVLVDLDWTVREGERWVLAGHNGSGKSTLLSLVLGDHPQSYVEHIRLFGKPRDEMPTPTLQANIGHTSPEIFNAFPRKHGRAALSAEEAIGTGFRAHFVYHPLDEAQQALFDRLVDRFPYKLTPEFLSTHFIELSPGEQSLVLFLRALVKEPKLLVLDEPFSGMDGEMVNKCKEHLEKGLNEEQAVVMISHFEEELPEGLGRVLKLDKGRVVEVI